MYLVGNRRAYQYRQFMIEFLTTHAIASRIEAIIRKAQYQVVLVSPYLQFSTTFVQRLYDAERRGVEIVVIYGKDELSTEARSALAELRRLRLYYCENLHAKCYFNAEAMVITSMNLYEYSEKNNREMGVWVTADEPLYDDAWEEALSIKEISEQRFLNEAQRAAAETPFGEERFTRPGRQGEGYCIRCRASIAHDPNRPFCRTCYTVWAQWEDAWYPEVYCHTCGAESDTSMSKPECYSCFTGRPRMSSRLD